MSFADANRASIRVIEETSWGTTPVAGASREVRLTSSSLSAQKETTVSDEIRADRMVSAITEVSAMSSGDINFELSSGSTDEFLAAFVMGAWTRPMSMDLFKGKTLAITGTDEITVAGRDVSGYLTVGRRIKLDGFVNPRNNGYFTISAVDFASGDTVITVTDGATMLAESGSVYSRLYDANDAIIINNTSITATATGFSGNGSDPFAAAIAAGQIVPGQNIAVSGIGIEEGEIDVTGTLSAFAVTISDGDNSVTLTAGTDFAVGDSAVNDAAALAQAINGLRFRDTQPVSVKASVAASTITVSNLLKSGGSITTETADASAAVTNFAGGVATATGVFTVQTVSDDTITVLPAPTAAPAQNVTVKACMLRNPGNVTEIAQRKFTIETGYNDIGQYMVQDGMVPGTFSLEISTGSIITGTVGFEGRSTRLEQSTILGNTATYDVLEAPSGEVVNATTDVGNLTKDGTDLSACIQSLSISGEASLRQQACIGSKFSRGIGAGRFNLTGSMSIFFEDEAWFEDFINHDTVALTFSVTDIEGAAYYWTIPAIKISQDEISPGGIDQDVIENIEFTAFRDAATNCMMQVDRFSATTEV